MISCEKISFDIGLQAHPFIVLFTQVIIESVKKGILTQTILKLHFELNWALIHLSLISV